MRIGIWGSSGFLGAELVKIFSARQDVEIVYTATSRKTTGAIKDVQIAFLALRPEQSTELAPKLLEAGIKVIDLSGGFRLKDTSLFEKYYHFSHPRPDFLERAVYGLPEKNRETILNAQLIASAGCYATGIHFGLRPLVKSGLVPPSAKILARAVSGYTGAGKKVKIPKTIKSYKGKGGREHQHIPEIEQELNLREQLLFYPEIAPWPRGIEVFIYVRLTSVIDILNLYQQFYETEKFIRIKLKPEEIRIDDVAGTNFCDICPQIKGSYAIIKVAIDNLGKGGAGQAVQNFDIMCGFPEELVY